MGLAAWLISFVSIWISWQVENVTRNLSSHLSLTFLCSCHRLNLAFSESNTIKWSTVNPPTLLLTNNKTICSSAITKLPDNHLTKESCSLYIRTLPNVSSVLIRDIALGTRSISYSCAPAFRSLSIFLRDTRVFGCHFWKSCWRQGDKSLLMNTYCLHHLLFVSWTLFIPPDLSFLIPSTSGCVGVSNTNGPTPILYVESSGGIGFIINYVFLGSWDPPLWNVQSGEQPDTTPPAQRTDRAAVRDSLQTPLATPSAKRPPPATTPQRPQWSAPPSKLQPPPSAPPHTSSEQGAPKRDRIPAPKLKNATTPLSINKTCSPHWLTQEEEWSPLLPTSVLVHIKIMVNESRWRTLPYGITECCTFLGFFHLFIL